MLPQAQAKPGDDDEREADERAGHAADELVGRELDDADGGDRAAGHVRPRQAIAGEHDGEADREEHLHLDHQRRQPHRHAELDAEEQQAELEQPDREAVGRDVAPRHRRPAHEEHRRHGSEEEAQRREGERRHLVERDADGYEGEAPERDHGENPREVGGRERGAILQRRQPEFGKFKSLWYAQRMRPRARGRHSRACGSGSQDAIHGYFFAKSPA